MCGSRQSSNSNKSSESGQKAGLGPRFARCCQLAAHIALLPGKVRVYGLGFRVLGKVRFERVCECAGNCVGHVAIDDLKLRGQMAVAPLARSQLAVRVILGLQGLTELLL